MNRNLIFCFLFIVVTSSFPSTFIYYVSPFGLILFALLGLRIISIKKLVLLFLAILVLSIFLYSSRASFNWAGFILHFLTFLPLYLLLVRNKQFSCSKIELDFFKTSLAVILSIQSLIAIVQVTVSGNWDAVSGTYGFFDFVTGNITISQVMFTFNTVVILFFLFETDNVAIRAICFFGLVAFLIAQSGHQTIFLLLTSFVVYVKLRFKSIIKYSVVSGLVLAISVIYIPTISKIAVSWFSFFLQGNLPKSLVVINYFSSISTNEFLLGLGPGQLSSRAALISSGQYLSVNLPNFLVGKSLLFEEIMDPILELYSKVGQDSAIAAPYFSHFTLLSEFGLIIYIVIIIGAIKEFLKNRNLIHSDITTEVKKLARFKNAVIVFLVLCSVIENYLEFVQAIILPFFLFIIAEGRINQLLKENDKE